MRKINKSLTTIAALLACEVAIRAQIAKQRETVANDAGMGPTERQGDLELFDRLTAQSQKRTGWWEADRTRHLQREEAAKAKAAEEAKAKAAVKQPATTAVKSA